jgi:histone acetyltransferase 1
VLINLFLSCLYNIVKAVPGSGDDDDEDDIIEFNPDFTYPIFGEQEQIFGYKDLMINVRK